MSEETSKNESGWTTDTLKAHYDQRLLDMDKAIIKALGATEKRFESVNEFRATLSDQTNTFLPRAEFDATSEALKERMTVLTTRIDKTDAQKQGSEITMGKIYTVIGLTATIFGLIIGLTRAFFG